MYKKALFIFSMVCVLGMSQAGGDTEPDPVNTSLRLLTIIDSGEYPKVWDKLSGYIRQTVRKKKWLTQMADARNPLGSVISRELISEQYHSGLPGAPCFECFRHIRYVILQYNTRFEKQSSVKETMTLIREESGEWRLFDYYLGISCKL